MNHRLDGNAVTRPAWIRVPAPQGSGVEAVQNTLRGLGLNTVCEEASCPNLGECFRAGTATFLVMGPSCTRACPYCDIGFERRPPLPDPGEARRLAEAARRMRLQHIVITSVNRDDLPDGGANHIALCVQRVREAVPGITVEVLIPDFCGSPSALAAVLAAAPEVINHNVETVPRLYRRVRPGGEYARSLGLLAMARSAAPHAYLKSGLMVGLGETEPEVRAVMADLRAAGCDILTLGQYLQPSLRHLRVEAYIAPHYFESWRCLGLEMGFLQVISSPLARSSYHAAQVRQLMYSHPRP